MARKEKSGPISDGRVEIKVLFSVRAKDMTGLAEMLLEVLSSNNNRDCLDKLITKYPGLEELRGYMVLALNQEYTSEAAPVKDKDELTIVPAISGS